MSVESFDMTAEVLQTSCSREGWLDAVLERFARDGCAVVLDLLDSDEVRSLREAMYDVQRRIHADIGRERLERAGELGVLRLMMKYDARFIRLLQHPALLDFVDATVSPTAVLHLQNGFILPPYPRDEHPEVFQNHFHQDFPRVLNGYVCSVNVLVTIDAFTEDNGGTLVVPGSQQQSGRPPDSELDRAVAVCCPPGSAIVFDSTLWHAAGRNTSGIDRVGINHQFTRSYFKQQMDLVRALGPDVVEQQVSRTRQLLGWYTRVPTSLDDYYQPPDKRLYRAGQG